jgi:thioredoxin-dependent peroxiredoxin
MEAKMALQIGDIAPDFEADTTEGRIKFHDYIEGSWVVFFSHPKDFTPVCTTELGSMAKMKHEFDKRGVKLIGISIDSVEAHHRWKNDIKDVTGATVNYPMIGDEDLHVAKLYGMIHPNATAMPEPHGGGQPDGPQCLHRRAGQEDQVFVSYPMSTGRNFNEIVRVIDSLQLTATKSVATPADWKQGEDVIILASVSDEAAKEKFPGGWKTLKPYLRVVPQPK